jgi:predicted nucleotidyltransferase
MAVGIICEYNPFHNGHIYHLERVKEIAKDEPVVLVMSGNFTQRGNLSIIEKYDKARIALEYGVDLVVELPFQFATESSDYFAKGAIKLLNELKCKKLVFGSESNNVDELVNLANIQLNNKEYEKLVKDELDKGINYPTAMSNALKIITNSTVNTPNDLLGLSYIKEIIKNKYDIKPITIKRTNDYNSKIVEGNITSATSIREAIKNKEDISTTLPKEALKYIIDIDENKYFELLKYKIISDKDLSIYQTVDEGLDNKLVKEINNSKNLDELIDNIKSKRYTYNKITRMFTHIICSLTKEENKKYNDISFINVLGFSEKGKKYLNSIKKDINIPIVTNINKNNIDLLNIELRVDNIYNLITNRNDNLYSKKPIIKDIANK